RDIAVDLGAAVFRKRIPVRARSVHLDGRHCVGIDGTRHGEYAGGYHAATVRPSPTATDTKRARRRLPAGSFYSDAFFTHVRPVGAMGRRGQPGHEQMD